MIKMDVVLKNWVKHDNSKVRKNNFMTNSIKTNNKLIFTSSGGLFPHKHTLEISSDLLQNLETPITLFTSTEYSLIFKHKHPVTLTIDHMKSLKSGQEIIITDDDTQRHQFKMKL